VRKLFDRTNDSGGIHSGSVRRMVGPNASDLIRAQQLVWNVQSRTPTFVRMVSGAHPLSREEWQKVKAPVLIISGEEVPGSFTPLTLRITFVHQPTDER